MQPHYNFSRLGRFTFRWSQFLILLLPLLLAQCGGGGGGESPAPPPTSTSSNQWVKIDPVSASLSSSISLTGIAWVSNDYVKLHCTGFACLFDQSTNNYPGVNVSYANLTSGESGQAISYYGGGTGWTHLWQASVHVVPGINTIQVSAYDPSGKGGYATISVSANPVTSIVITPNSPSIAKGTTLQLAATGTRSDNSTVDLTQQVTWASSNSSIASISSAGLAYAASVGSTSISATWQGVSGSTSLNVTQATLTSIAVSPTPLTLPTGATQQYTATGTFSDNTTQNVTTVANWGGSDTTVASISNTSGSNGIVTAISSGTTMITATSGAISGSASLTVKDIASIIALPTSSQLLKGTTQQFEARAVFTDTTLMLLKATDVTWNSLDTMVATISTNGLATAMNSGSTTITATLIASSGSASLTVSSWIPQNSGMTEPLFDVTWTGTQFMAVRSVNLVLTSPDGVSWSQRSLDPFMVNTLYGVTACGARMAAVGNYIFLTSQDGVAWSSSTTSEVLSGVACSLTKFVAVGSSGTIITSSDGVVSSGTTQGLLGIAWSGSQFVAVGYGGTILTSQDGVIWIIQTSGVTETLYAVTWSGTQFVAVGSYGPILTSPDGVTWTSHHYGNNLLYSIAWSGTQFVAVGNGGTILTSLDGVTWQTTLMLGGSNYLHGVAWSGTRFVAVGSNGMILTYP